MWPDRIPALVIVDTGNDHITEIVLGEDLTANRTLTITTGDSDGEIHTPSLTGKNFVSKSNTNYTAAAGEHVLYTLTSTDGTLTLKTSPATGDTIQVTAVSLTGGYQLTITGTTKNILLREGSATSCKLFVTNDHLTLRYNGTAWCVLEDGRKLHACTLIRSTDQTGIVSNVWTKIQTNVIRTDIGGMADSANYEIDILRDGLYGLTLKYRYTSQTVGKIRVGRISRNGTSDNVFYKYDGIAETGDMLTATTKYELSAGDVLQSLAFHNHGSDRTIAGPNPDQSCQFSVREIG